MRVAFACPFGTGLKATVRSRSLPLASQLAQKGHTVRVIVPPWDSVEEADSVLLFKGVEVHRVRTRQGPAITVADMMRRILEFRPDVVHVVKPRAYAGIVQFICRALANAPAPRRPLLVLDADDWEQAWNPGMSGGPVLAKFLTWQEEWGWRNCDGLTLASQWLWRRAGLTAPHVPRLYLPNGVEEGAIATARSRAGGKSREKNGKVLWLTRFTEVSPAWIRRFHNELRREGPHWKLLIAGSSIQPGLEEEFKAVFADGEYDSPQFLGFVSRGRLLELYGECDCVIAPAREDAAGLAKCSVKLLDTSRYSSQCIASEVGEQVRFQGMDSVVLLDASTTPEVFARRAAKALRDASPMRAEARTGTPRPAPAWNELAVHLETFYEDLAAKAS